MNTREQVAFAETMRDKVRTRLEVAQEIQKVSADAPQTYLPGLIRAIEIINRLNAADIKQLHAELGGLLRPE